jgi:hypothetical protein
VNLMEDEKFKVSLKAALELQRLLLDAAAKAGVDWRRDEWTHSEWNLVANELTKQLLVKDDLQAAVVALGKQLRIAEAEVNAKHAQWQAAVGLGENERARRQQIEGDVSDLLSALCSGDLMAAKETLEERLKKVLHPTEPAEQLCYPETVESDWRNAFALVDGSVIAMGWEPPDEGFPSLMHEAQAMCDFLEKYEEEQREDNS